MQTSRIVAIALLVACTSGCATVGSWIGLGGDEAAKEDEKKELQAAADQKATNELKEQLDKQTKHVARLQLEVQVMREKLATVRRQIQVLSRGNRSGIFYDDPSVDVEDKAIGFEDEGEDSKQNAKPPALTHAPDAKNGETKDADKGVATAAGHASPKTDARDTVGRSGFSEEADEDEEESLDEPARLMADAELKMRRSQYGEAIVSLKELEKRFPEYSDGGAGKLLLAEAWLKLASYENVLPVLRSFYLKHPNSNDTLRAKLIEAQSFEGAGHKERAAALYREIVSQGPQSSYGQRARASLQKLRDVR